MCRLQKQPVVFAQRLVYLKAPKKGPEIRGENLPLTEMRGNLCMVESFRGSQSVCIQIECVHVACVHVSRVSQCLLLLDKYVLRVLGFKEQATGA